MAIVCLGELLVDMVSPMPDATLSQASRFVKAPGGAPANVAVGVRRLGVASQFVGAVGDDPFGYWLRDVLTAEQVGVDYLALTASARTTIAFVATRQDGAKDICFYRNPGADAQLTADDVPDSVFQGAKILHCGSVSLSMEPCRSAQLDLVRRARECGLLVSFDPNWRPSLWDDHEAAYHLIWQMMPLADIVKIADEELEFVTHTHSIEQAAKQVLAKGPRLVVVTRGGQDVFYATSAFNSKVPTFAVVPQDTLGAGDAFVAGLLAGVVEAESLDLLIGDRVRLEDALRFANACGALATQKTGAMPSLPTRQEALAWMRSEG